VGEEVDEGVIQAEREQDGANCSFGGSGKEWDGHGASFDFSSQEPVVSSQEPRIRIEVKSPTLSETAREGWGILLLGWGRI
jgi:hypothetical protein